MAKCIAVKESDGQIQTTWQLLLGHKRATVTNDDENVKTIGNSDFTGTAVTLEVAQWQANAFANVGAKYVNAAGEDSRDAQEHSLEAKADGLGKRTAKSISANRSC